VSIAKEIELEDPLENAGAQLIREVASKTNGKLLFSCFALSTGRLCALLWP